MTEKDQETDIQRDMKQGKLKLSRFGLGFELTGFTAFLSWAGMWLYSLLGLAAMAMITVPTDFNLRPSIVLGSSIDLTRAERMYDLCVLQGCGAALLGIFIGYFIMNFFLRKRNKEKNLQGVKKMLTIICSISAGLMVAIYSALIALLVFAIFFIGTNYNFLLGTLILIPALCFWCLLLHGIRKERSGYVKAFLVFQYTLAGLYMTAVAVASIMAAALYGMVSILLIGILYIMVLTFLFVFNIGFYVSLHSIFLASEKSQQQMKKNMEFINASFEKF